MLTQLQAIQTQMDLRAKVLAEFVATQSDFALLVGDRAELQRIADSALAIEDVLFVVVTDRGGESARAVRPGFPSEKIPAANIPAANIPAANIPAANIPAANMDPGIFEIVQPVLARTGTSVVEWETPNTPAERMGTVRIGFSLERQQKLRRGTLRVSVAIALLALTVILAVQYTQLRRLLDPLKGLIDFTRQVGQGHRSMRAAVQHRDEVGRLAEAFNRMVEELGSTTVSKNYMNNIIRSMGESLMVIGPDHTIRTVNQATLAMLV
jgi:HAMP domain-containing protein